MSSAALVKALGPSIISALKFANANPNLTRAAASGVYKTGKRMFSGKRKRQGDVYSNKRRTNRTTQRSLYNSRTAATTRKATKVAGRRRKPKKTIKVGRKMREKIKKVIDDEDQVVGTHIYSARPMTLVQNNENRKTWVMYPGFGTSTGAFPGFPASGEVYSWNLVLDAASKLFNGKASLEYPAIGDAGNFNPRTLEVDIDYCKVKFWLKNNSERNVRLACFKCTSTSKIGGNYNPLELFKIASASAQAQGLVNTPMAVSDIGDQAGTTVWRNSPQFFDDWRSQWKVEKTEWILAPGQTDSYSFRIDKDKVSGSKNYIDSSYQSYHKGAVYCMWSIINDVINTSSVINDPGVAGYFLTPDLAGRPQQCVIIECERTMKISLPEQAGFVLPVSVPSATNTPLTFRRSNTFYEEYYNALPTEANYQRVDEQSPYDSFNS